MVLLFYTVRMCGYQSSYRELWPRRQRRPGKPGPRWVEGCITLQHLDNVAPSTTANLNKCHRSTSVNANHQFILITVVCKSRHLSNLQTSAYFKSHLFISFHNVFTWKVHLADTFEITHQYFVYNHIFITQFHLV